MQPVFSSILVMQRLYFFPTSTDGRKAERLRAVHVQPEECTAIEAVLLPVAEPAATHFLKSLRAELTAKEQTCQHFQCSELTRF